MRTWELSDGLTLADVACRHGRGRGVETEQATVHAIAFVRRGCFVRDARAGEQVLDPTLAYCMNPGDEQRYDHPHDHGDDCTAIFLTPELAASIWGGVPELPSTPLRVDPLLDVRHRRLLAEAARGGDTHATAEAAIGLVAAALTGASARQVASGRPATEHRRAALVRGVRERLAATPDWALPQLAAELAISPHHLSRIFRQATGETISRHRMRIRTRLALERLAGGDTNLARIAADTGFADQSHLCRVLRAETTETPAALRAALAD